MDREKVIVLYQEMLADLEMLVDFNVDASLIRKCRKSLLICTGDFGSVNEFINLYSQHTDNNKKLIIAGQRGMEDSVKNIVRVPMEYVGWKGRYTAELADHIKEKCDASDLDSVFFLSRSPLDTRDRNVFEIVDKLTANHDITLCNYAISGSMSRFNDRRRYVAWMNMYESMLAYVHEMM